MGSNREERGVLRDIWTHRERHRRIHDLEQRGTSAVEDAREIREVVVEWVRQLL